MDAKLMEFLYRLEGNKKFAEVCTSMSPASPLRALYFPSRSLYPALSFPWSLPNLKFEPSQVLATKARFILDTDSWHINHNILFATRYTLSLSLCGGTSVNFLLKEM